MSRAKSFKNILTQSIDSGSAWVSSRQGTIQRGTGQCADFAARADAATSLSSASHLSKKPVHSSTGDTHCRGSGFKLLAGGIQAHVSDTDAGVCPHGCYSLHHRVSAHWRACSWGL